MAGSRIRTQPDPCPLALAAGEVLSEAGIGPASRVCVALSGGVDSVVLLHLLLQMRSEFGYSLSAAHVHHGLSPHADQWRAFCERLCAALALPFEAFMVEIDRDDPAGLEAAARHARQAALNTVAADWLALGHHRDDQAETVLFRLLRGAGVRGAAAMKRVDAGKEGAPGRIRPLLGVARADIVAFARASGLSWVDDESNADPGFSRNFLRHRIMPAIGEAFPGAAATLARAADNFREADALLDALADIDRAHCGGDALDYEALMGLDDARLANLLRNMAMRLDVRPPSRVRLVEVMRQLRESGGRPLSVSVGEVACRVYRGRVRLERIDITDLAPARWSGETRLPWGSGSVRFDRVTGAGIGLTVLETAAAVELVAPWAGLALRPASGRPRQRFKKLCQAHGIPSWLRTRLPVLRAGERALWIAELGVSADHRCQPGEPGIVPVWET